MVPGMSLDEVEISFEEESGILDYNATIESYGENQGIYRSQSNNVIMD